MTKRDMGKISEQFLRRAKIRRRRVAIAIMRPIKETLDSLKKANNIADITVVGAKISGHTNVIELDQDKASVKLISLLKNGEVDGIVRGQVKDSFTLDEFHRQFNKISLPSNKKVCPALVSNGKYEFITSTVSVYQGLTLEDKKYEVERIVRYIEEELKIEPKIAIMSTLRPTSKVGKYPILDEWAKINSDLNSYLVGKGLDSKEYFFEYESAVWEKRNLIVCSTGLVGNAWLKALVYLGGWQLISCPYLDLGVVYEDGSRNEKDFYWHIVHAVAMANIKI